LKDVLQFKVHNFPNMPSIIQLTALAMMFIYYRYKSIITCAIEKIITHCLAFRYKYITSKICLKQKLY